MNVLLDEKCTTIDGISQFLDEYQPADTTAASSKELPNTTASQHTPIQEHLPVAAINSQLLRLKREYELVSTALTTKEHLKNPNEHQGELLKTLRSIDGDSDVEQEISSLIHTQWYDKAREESFKKVNQYIEQYHWPQKDFAPLDTSKPEFEIALRQAFENALEIDQAGLFSVLAKPIGDRIVYHFIKSSDTANKEKPEWLFTYLLKLLELRSLWLTSQLQLLVAEPTDQLIQALFPVLSYSCRGFVKNETYMLEIIRCAETLERDFWVSKETSNAFIAKLSGGENKIRHFISEQSEVYSAALQSIVSSPSSTDFDADVPSAKPTFAALHVKQLLTDADTILRLNPSLVLEKCHLRVLEEYRQLLEDVVSEFNPLCEAFGSASYFKSILDSWSTQLIIASVESFRVRESIEKYGDLRLSLASRVVKTMLRTAQRSLRPYFNINWRECEDSSAELRQFDDSTRHEINRIFKLTASSRADWARILAPFTEQLAELLLFSVVQGNVFTQKSAALLQNDIEHIWNEFKLPKTRKTHELFDSVTILKTGEPKSDYLSKEHIRGLIGRRKDF